MKQQINSIPKSWSLDSELRRQLWTYWKGRSPSWVEGVFDGGLSWSDAAINALPCLPLLQDLFFGFMISDQQYAMMIQEKLIPAGLIPELDQKISESKQEEPAKSLVKLKKKSKRWVAKRETVLVIALKGYLEVGRASRTFKGAWKAVEWHGVEEGRTEVVPTITIAIEWLKSIPGVTRVMRMKRPISG